MTQAVVPPALRVAGDTHVGKVRTTNEDSMICDPARGLYVVLDGMGGANAGDIASQIARDAIRDFVTQRRLTMEPKALLESAIQYGSASVFNAAQQARERHGMGTTVVACLVVDTPQDTSGAHRVASKRVVVAHVGDSRAYLLRQGRLQALTRDHTIVEELVDRGVIPAEEADRHPYKNVLSRNLGARPETKVDSVELELVAGDRLMLCSDGLYGYASTEAMQYLLGSGDAPEAVARDLIDLALRGGGGDNVSTIVIEAPQAAPTTTQVVRTSGATAWWQKRALFLDIAKDRGITKNPICRSLAPDEALELVALSLCQAIFHDLEKSTGVNVWTFAQNIGGGWFETGGEWSALRNLMDILATSARVVVDDIRAADAKLGFLLDVAVSRALVVAELALGGLLADRLRQVDADLIQVHAAMQDAAEAQTAQEATTNDPDVVDTDVRFVEQATIPFMRPERPVTHPGISAELISAIEKTLTIARGRTSQRAELVRQILTALESISIDASGNFASAVLAARDIYGGRTFDDSSIIQVFDALDSARIIIASSVHQTSVPDAVRAKVLRAISFAHQRLVNAVTGLVLEAVAPISKPKRRKASPPSSATRSRVPKKKRAELERKFAANIDQSQPWEKRGVTNGDMSDVDLFKPDPRPARQVLDTVSTAITDRQAPSCSMRCCVRSRSVANRCRASMSRCTMQSQATRLGRQRRGRARRRRDRVRSHDGGGRPRAARPRESHGRRQALTQVAVTVARVVSLAAVGRASRDRAARLREEMAQRQRREVLDKQHVSIGNLERETTNSD